MLFYVILCLSFPFPFSVHLLIGQSSYIWFSTCEHLYNWWETLRCFSTSPFVYPSLPLSIYLLASLGMSIHLFIYVCEYMQNQWYFSILPSSILPSTYLTTVFLCLLIYLEVCLHLVVVPKMITYPSSSLSPPLPFISPLVFVSVYLFTCIWRSSLYSEGAHTSLLITLPSISLFSLPVCLILCLWAFADLVGVEKCVSISPSVYSVSFLSVSWPVYAFLYMLMCLSGFKRVL